MCLYHILFHIRSLHPPSCDDKQVNMDHPVIREACKNGNTIFVISTLYQAERCNIAVSFSERVDATASVSAQASASCVPLLGATEGGGVDDSKSSAKGVELFTCTCTCMNPPSLPLSLSSYLYSCQSRPVHSHSLSSPSTGHQL